MNKSSILAATIAIARGISLKAETKDILDDLGNIGNDILDFGAGLGEDMLDLTINTGEALIDPNTYVNIGETLVDVTVDTANWLVDPQSYVDLGNSIADGTVDTVNWMGDGSNWEAAGKTLGYGSLALITGNPDTAWELWTNEDLYTGDGWVVKDPSDDPQVQKAYDDYVKEVEKYNTQTLPQMRVDADEFCVEWSDKWGYDQEIGKEYGRRRNTYTATYELTGYLAEDDDTIEEMFKVMFKDKPSYDDCDYEDCLHPCYGPTHGKYCHTCFLVGLGKIEAGAPFVFTEDEQKVCDACTIPPKEAEPITPMTKDEYVQKLKEASASK